jgi:AraC family transcriptional regulator of adaptative response/methylated-DNA-[protein]-cysteine methyltransferase
MTASFETSISNGDQRAANGRTEEDIIVLGEDEAWAAVSEHDQRFDGLFVYAVATTGIYCRPSCPARRPNRENVTFFPTPEKAEIAGHRACRRCHPDRQHGSAAQGAVEEARAYLEAHLDENVTLKLLASHTEFSAAHLQRAFKRFVGVSPKEYQNMRRLEAFKNNVGAECDVLEATFEAGFGSSRALYERAKEGLGMTPGSYRRGGDGYVVRFTTLTSDFGTILVAATEQGVCTVSLGDSEASLEKDLRREYFKATAIERDDRGLGPWVEPVVRYLDGIHTHPTVPLDVQGTDFQRRVWRLLQKIPYGETRSYGEIAEMLGQPKAARAVAQACASNAVALVIPCHRVVRKDGEASGYRWGIGWKKRLLELERRGRVHSR